MIFISALDRFICQKTYAMRRGEVCFFSSAFDDFALLSWCTLCGGEKFVLSFRVAILTIRIFFHIVLKEC